VPPLAQDMDDFFFQRMSWIFRCCDFTYCTGCRCRPTNSTQVMWYSVCKVGGIAGTQVRPWIIHEHSSCYNSSNERPSLRDRPNRKSQIDPVATS